MPFTALPGLGPIVIAGAAMAGALAAFLARRWPRAAAAAGAAGAGAVTAAALVLPISPSLLVGDAAIIDSSYMRAWLALMAGVTAVLLLSAALAPARDDAPPDQETPVVTGAAICGTAICLSLDGPAVALTLAASLGLLSMIGAHRSWAAGFRQAALVPAIALVALVTAAALPHQTPAAGAGQLPSLVIFAPPALAALAIALRTGALPFHVSPLRVARGTPFGITAIGAAWLPALFALLGATWLVNPQSASILARPELQVPLVGLAGITILLAVPAMLVQEDLGAVIAVHAIADSAIALLALAAGPEALPALAIWLATSAAARTAIAAWCLAASARMGARVVSGQPGWARVAPLLVSGLALAALAGVGLPGWPVFDARIELMNRALSGLIEPAFATPAAALLATASAAIAVGYLRLLIVGLRTPSEEAREAVSWSARAGSWSTAVLVAALALIPIGLGLLPADLIAAAGAWPPAPP